MTRLFFYGLFMDTTLLAEKGFHPEVVGPAVVPGYRIHVGDRATLLRSASSRVYGIVMRLASGEARALYSEPSVSEYALVRVRAELLDTGEAIEADCYILPPEFGRAGANPAYADKLSRLNESLRFNPQYVEEIARFGSVRRSLDREG